MILAQGGLVRVPFPRLLTLFLRQRAFAGTLVALLAFDAVLGWLTGWIEAVDRPERVHYVLLLAPCIVPAMIGTAMWSRGADMETHVPFPLWWPRVAHLAVLVAVGIGGSTVVVGSWAGQEAPIHQGAFWLRSSLVALALALVAARTFGARFAWVLPMALALVVFSAELRQAPMVPHDYPWWLWMIRRTDDALSWVTAAAMGVAAVAMFARWGPKPDDPGEA